MKLLTPNQVTRIVNNVSNVINSGDITKLTKQSYRFLMLCSGFIAHYDIYGFQDVYQDTQELKADLLTFKENNQWKNFRVGEKNAEYYHQKRDIYNAILEKI